MLLEPVFHAGAGSIEIARGNGLTFVANAVDGDDSPALHKEPEDAGVEFADVPQFEEAIAQRFRKWRAVVLAMAQFGEPGDDGSEVARIRGFQVIEKFTRGAFPLSFRKTLR